MERGKHLKKEMPLKVRMRLVVSLPIITTSFTLASGFLLLGLLKRSFQLRPETMLSTVQWILLLAAVSCISGILLALGITRPLIGMASSIKRLIEREGEKLEISAPNEIRALTSLFDKGMVSINRFIQDHHLLDSLPQGIITLDSHGRVTSINNTAKELLGVDHHIEGRYLEDIFPPIKENEALLSTIKYAIKTGKSLAQEVTFYLPKKSGSLWLEPLIVKDTEGPRLVITFKDLAGIKSIRKKISRTEQLAYLGTLISGISHEVRNPLGSIRGLTELIDREIKEEDPKKVYTKTMLNEIDRLNNIVEDLLNLGQPPRSELIPLDISQILSTTVSIARKRFNKAIEVVEDYQDGLPEVIGDRERLTQAFLNILINAFEAKPKNIKISVRQSDEDKIIINISDTGCGIEERHIKDIFDPFFTTKQKGSGLGLTIAKNIIDAHGGDIKVKTEKGKGTTFNITLPIC